ncbi:MAG TPA: type VI secretion system tube protein Hcp [Pirellulales bacterium]|jgi:type VI protein secretion system component Hcp|nr:type VI secretion system tube protein Hcp [Pirellulales bacterium]
MAKQSLDAFLELTPSRKMTAEIAGEALDSKQNESARAKALLEIMSFRFGDAKSLAKAKAADKKAAKQEGDDDDDDAALPVVGTAKRTGNIEEDYRFQITKQIEKATPILAQAYFSNSFKPKRHEYNSFDEAKITIRKLGAHAKHPKAYFTVTFRGVYIVGYDLQTQGPDPPEETIDFCFQTCEMSYKSQSAEGTLGTANVKGWNFVAQREMSRR